MAVKRLLGKREQPISESLIQVPALLLIQVPANVHPGRQQMVSVLRPLPHMWETWIECQAHGFSLDQLWLLWALGE